MYEGSGVLIPGDCNRYGRRIGVKNVLLNIRYFQSDVSDVDLKPYTFDWYCKKKNSSQDKGFQI